VNRRAGSACTSDGELEVTLPFEGASLFSMTGYDKVVVTNLEPLLTTCEIAA
jgi:hypothetical protein